MYTYMYVDIHIHMHIHLQLGFPPQISRTSFYVSPCSSMPTPFLKRTERKDPLLGYMHHCNSFVREAWDR